MFSLRNKKVSQDYPQNSILTCHFWIKLQQNGSIYLRKQQAMQVKRFDIQTDGKTEIADDIEYAEEAVAEVWHSAPSKKG